MLFFVNIKATDDSKKQKFACVTVCQQKLQTKSQQIIVLGLFMRGTLYEANKEIRGAVLFGVVRKKCNKGIMQNSCNLRRSFFLNAAARALNNEITLHFGRGDNHMYRTLLFVRRRDDAHGSHINIESCEHVYTFLMAF